jgi:protein TonB
MKIRKFLVLAVLLACSTLALAQAGSDVAPTRRLRISSALAEKLKIQDVTPQYPQKARENSIQGDVLLAATIDTEGKITNLKVVSGHPILADAAVEAVKQWKYRPYLLNGEPVLVDTLIKVQFHID